MHHIDGGNNHVFGVINTRQLLHFLSHTPWGEIPVWESLDQNVIYVTQSCSQLYYSVFHGNTMFALWPSGPPPPPLLPPQGADRTGSLSAVALCRLLLFRTTGKGLCLSPSSCSSASFSFLDWPSVFIHSHSQALQLRLGPLDPIGLSVTLIAVIFYFYFFVLLFVNTVDPLVIAQNEICFVRSLLVWSLLN